VSFEIASFGYLAALLISIAGLGAIDHRQKLALFVHTKATVLSVSIGVVVFLIWDLLGIALGIFFRGNAPHLSGILLAPELPIEELFFLILLCYNTLLACCFFARRLAK
jgi:lycopene cyclase domain-containing protein